MAVKLHRCSQMWMKIGVHPCWRVQKALDEAGVDYEVVKHPVFPRSKRTDYVRLTGGQVALPAIELEDGAVIREESKDLAARVRDGSLIPPPGSSGTAPSSLG